jgi:ubiquitin-protein ligase
MSTSRDDRLRTDIEEMLRLRTQSEGLIDFDPSSKGMPEQWVITLRCTSVYLDSRHRDPIRRRDEHQVAIQLGPNYPLAPPHLLWTTPILHPNIRDDGLVCLNTGLWGSRTTLTDLCVWLWDLASYKNYNIDTSPWDPIATRWAREHRAEFPLDRRDPRAPRAVSPSTTAPVRTGLRGDEVQSLIDWDSPAQDPQSLIDWDDDAPGPPQGTA